MVSKTVPHVCGAAASLGSVNVHIRQLCLISLQGLLGVRGGDASAAGISKEAAQAMRAGMQEDFELLEPFENEDQLEGGTANESEEGERTPRIHSAGITVSISSNI